MNLTGTKILPVTPFDVDSIRDDFPVLKTKAHGKPLVYFDNAATSQKPQVVIDKLVDYYSNYNANIHRGVHYLSQKASNEFDEVRNIVHRFINSTSANEIVFVRGTTEGINLIAATYGRQNIKQGDEIIISAMEHHSNIVPWQMLCEEKGATLKIIPINESGELILDEYYSLLNDKTKLVSVVHTSNSLGTVNPLKEIIEAAHLRNIPVVVDAAQGIVHSEIDVLQLDCDFLVFSGHKVFGPTGVGILYGKANLLESMPPYQGGGEMISSVTFEKTTYNEIPYKFEAGTPNIADVIAFGTALNYFDSLDRKALHSYETDLLNYAQEKLMMIPGVRIIGQAKEKASVVSFVIDGCNALDVGMYLDTKGIAVRTGQHCTEPVMKRYAIPGTIRASFLFYNTFEEIDLFIDGVIKAIQLLKQ